MAKRICPRCKRHLDAEMFEDPVAICMVCYSNVPSNQECYDEDERVWLDNLREKATKSKWAKVRVKRSVNSNRFGIGKGNKQLDARRMMPINDVRYMPTGSYQCEGCGYEIEEFDRDHHNEKQCKDPIWRRMMAEPDNEETGLEYKVRPVNPDGSTANAVDPLGILAKAKGRKGEES